MPDDDQDKAIAYRRAKAELCPQCGTRESDWLDEQGHYHLPPIVEPWVVTCPGCLALERERGALDETRRASQAVNVVVMPFDPERREGWENESPIGGSGWGQDDAPPEEPAPE